MKNKNYTKLHGYENEKVENEEELLDEEESLDENDFFDNSDDDFYSDDYNGFENDDFCTSGMSGFGGLSGFGMGGFGGSNGMNRVENLGCMGGSNELGSSKSKWKFFNKNKKPDFAITNTDVENANIKGFLTGLVTGVISLLSLFVFIKHITSKK